MLIVLFNERDKELNPAMRVRLAVLLEGMESTLGNTKKHGNAASWVADGTRKIKQSVYSIESQQKTKKDKKKKK